MEVDQAQLEAIVLSPARLAAALSGPRETDWYFADTVLREFHDEGSHGRLDLIWFNGVLVRARNWDEAIEKAIARGAFLASDGDHPCGGERAQWEFAGLAGLRRLAEAPGDGAVLWRECSTASEGELHKLIPPMRELTIFRHLRSLPPNTGD